MPDGPLIVQSDKTLLLEIDHPLADETRVAIAPFAELERAPEHVHTYRVTPLALWNARAAGHDAEQVVDALVRYSRYPVPQPLLVDVVDTMGKFGRLQLANNPAHGLVMTTIDRAVLEEILRNKKIRPMLGERIDDDTVLVHPSERGRLKQALLKAGWPAEDFAGYVDGEHHDIDESVYLADRVLVLSTAPTRVVETLKVGLPRERDQITTRESEEFVHLRGEVARLLKHTELAH